MIQEIPEQWAPIPGFEQFYEVSNMGRVRSKSRFVQRPPRGSWLCRGRVLKPGQTSEGYRTIVLSVRSVRTAFLVHRLVAQAFIPNPDGKPEVNHKFGDKSDNRASELEWATNPENIDHSVRVLKNHSCLKRKGKPVCQNQQH